MGQVRASMFVPSGYVKLGGATVNRSNYPRLVALADTYSLWTSDAAANPGLFGEGDGNTTMVLPNWTGRMAQFAATAGGKVDAGLPNVTGDFSTRIYSSSTAYAVTSVNSANGAFSSRVNGNNAMIFQYVPGTSVNHGSVNIDASRSNSIYSSSTTVQPPAINVFAIMRY